MVICAMSERRCSGSLTGLTEYDARRPLTTTGTNLLGLIKHLTNTEARYFGDVFGRPFPERLPWWGDDDFEPFADMWATADESRAEIVDRYRRAWDHSDATIAALDIDAPGHVPWWPRPNVKLFNVLVHVLTETNRHAGHADILREQLDGAVGTEQGSTAPATAGHGLLGEPPRQDPASSGGRGPASRLTLRKFVTDLAHESSPSPRRPSTVVPGPPRSSRCSTNR